MGQRIGFTSYRKGIPPDIYLMDPQGGSLTRFTSWAGDGSLVAWSYSRKRIAMVRERLNPTTNTYQDDIYLMNADGSNKRWARSQPSSFHITNPSWSPDGSRLVVTVIFGSKPYVATIEVATGNMAFVLQDGIDLIQVSPTAPPSGSPHTPLSTASRAGRRMGHG